MTSTPDLGNPAGSDTAVGGSDTCTGVGMAPVDVLDRAEAVLSELDELLLAARTPEELLSLNKRLEQHRSHLAAVQARVVTEIDVVHAAERADQWASAGQYLTAITAGRTGSGNRLLRTARALTTELHDSFEALRTGVISPDQADAIVHVMKLVPAKPDLRAAAEHYLLEAAAVCNATELGAAGTSMLEVIDPDGAEKRDEAALDRLERAAHLNRSLTISFDRLGGGRIRGRGSAEDLALVKKVLMSLSAPLPSTDPDCGLEGRDPRDHGARMFDALVQNAQHSLDAQVLPSDHGAKPRVIVTIDEADLRNQVGAGTLDTGEHLSAAATRKLACDADILAAVLGADGAVLDLARAQRLVTTMLWLALMLRDRHCAFPGCDRPPIACDAHHIRHWIDGGPTSLDNTVLLCRAHHTVIHSTAWEVRLNPADRLPEFRPPPGRHRLAPECRAALEERDGWVRDRRPRAT